MFGFENVPWYCAEVSTLTGWMVAATSELLWCLMLLRSWRHYLHGNSFNSPLKSGFLIQIWIYPKKSRCLVRKMFQCTVLKYIGWLDGGCAVEIFCDVWCCSAHEDIICMATALFYGFDETTTVNLGHKITLYSQPKKRIEEEIWYSFFKGYQFLNVSLFWWRTNECPC